MKIAAVRFHGVIRIAEIEFRTGKVSPPAARDIEAWCSQAGKSYVA